MSITGSAFSLRKAVAPSPERTTLRVMHSLPNAEYIKSLWLLDKQMGNKINTCLTMVYSHITERGAHGQGQAHFFHHVAATALYESYHAFLIHGKNHGIKAAGIYNKLIKTLQSIEAKLKLPTQISDTLVDILENFQAELMAHQCALVQALKQLPTETKAHLKEHQHLDVDALQLPDLTPRKKERVANMHPSPADKTPKRVSPTDELARAALRITPENAPLIVRLDLDNPPAQRPPVPVSLILSMVPRSVAVPPPRRATLPTPPVTTPATIEANANPEEPHKPAKRRLI